MTLDPIPLAVCPIQQLVTAHGIDQRQRFLSGKDFSAAKISQRQRFLGGKDFSAAGFSQLHLSYKSKVNWFPQADATDASLIL